MTADTKESFSWRLRVYPLIIIATLLGALVFAAVSYDVDDPASRLGGDYPSFYAAGSKAEFQANLARMVESCQRFLDLGKIECTHMSEYFLGSDSATKPNEPG